MAVNCVRTTRRGPPLDCLQRPAPLKQLPKWESLIQRWRGLGFARKWMHLFRADMNRKSLSATGNTHGWATAGNWEELSNSNFKVASIMGKRRREGHRKLTNDRARESERDTEGEREGGLFDLKSSRPSSHRLWSERANALATRFPFPFTTDVP